MLEGEELIIVRRTIERLEQQNVAFLHQIFSSLEIILCNLRYSKKIENLTLASYCIKTQGTEKISHFLKETQPLNTIKLSYIVFLYELIEDFLFKFVQDYISPEYRVSLSESYKIIIDKYLKESLCQTTKKLPSIEQLINAIQRFILRCLVAALESKFPIKEYLTRTDFWDLNVNEENIDQFNLNFPEEILICNTIPLLNHIKEYIKQKNDEENKEKYDISKDKVKYNLLRQSALKMNQKFI